MFREMRRKNQQMSEAEAVGTLEKCSAGTLAVLGDEGWPYAVPLSYVYQDGHIYFHCATRGHKLDALRGEPRVSFCVIDRDDVKPADFTTQFASVIAFGTARVIEDEAEKHRTIMALTKKYAPHHMRQGEVEAAKTWKAFHMVDVKVEHLTGKVAKELVRKEG